MSFSEDVIDLKCPLCFRRFYDPIILDCGHTFDRLCIQKRIDLNESFNPKRSSQCPLCIFTFDSKNSLISNQSLNNIIKSEPTFEWFFIDISHKQNTDVLIFLKRVFDKRDIFQTNRIIFETNDIRLVFNSNINFDQELKLKSISNLNNMLQEACNYLQQQDGLRKICILTDGLIKHSNLIKINSNIINQRFIIHVGDKNITRTRHLADDINFHFEHFNKRTFDIYVQHFILNF
ncbi:unnamed protein product [Rotaria sordida]|uniref:RING-type domain-containing protein n=1 Tax=Rotaria sordida TaxID=392033 RepID=A0A814EYF9_9BILA|nr:unnamed protein product [Rotaria sordida]